LTTAPRHLFFTGKGGVGKTSLAVRYRGNPAVFGFESGLLSVWDLDFLHGCVDEQHYDNGAQNDHPILNLNARYRCCPAKPFHNFPPGFTLRALLNDVSNLLESFKDS
jgi:hypothetical protein